MTLIPFPHRAYLPGAGVHPHVDLSWMAILETVHAGGQSTSLNYALDLFNFGYWWEAHEVLEVIWKECSDVEETDFLKGWIKLCAALVKDRQCHAMARDRLLEQGVKGVTSAVPGWPRGDQLQDAARGIISGERGLPLDVSRVP